MYFFLLHVVPFPMPSVTLPHCLTPQFCAMLSHSFSRMRQTSSVQSHLVLAACITTDNGSYVM